MTRPPVAPRLVLGWGNRSRGDDALGPCFVEQLRARFGAASGQVDFLEDFQLQVEHALDLQGRERVLFVDASRRCAAPFEVMSVAPLRDLSFTTHALSPAALLQVVRDLQQREPVECTMLAIRGERFELGAPLQRQAIDHLREALDWGERWARGATSR